MTDKELLIAAARATGIETRWTSGMLFGLKKNGWYLWNPLTDDGDALRLAVQLTLEIDICLTGVAVRTPNGVKVPVNSKEEPDAYAATRRAIVRAAAAIGSSHNPLLKL